MTHGGAGGSRDQDDGCVLAARAGLDRLAGHVEEDFRLEVFARVPPEARSVARREGLC